MCNEDSSILFRVFLTHVALNYLDAVVLWDWIISLHREYRFVNASHSFLNARF
jgi:hypothetical protein